MSHNEKYIAYTRALDELFVYSEVIDISGYEKKARMNNKKTIKDSNENVSAEKMSNTTMHTITKQKKEHIDSKVRSFFMDNGFEVIDKRDEGGRLWVVGEKTAIRDIVNKAISKFGISGKYASGKEIGFKNGWYTKTDK